MQRGNDGRRDCEKWLLTMKFKFRPNAAALFKHVGVNIFHHALKV